MQQRLCFIIKFYEFSSISNFKNTKKRCGETFFSNFLRFSVWLFSRFSRWGFLRRWKTGENFQKLFLSIRHHLVVWRFIKYQNNEMENFYRKPTNFSWDKMNIFPFSQESQQHVYARAKLKIWKIKDFEFNFHWDRIELQFWIFKLKYNPISSIKFPCNFQFSTDFLLFSSKFLHIPFYSKSEKFWNLFLFLIMKIKKFLHVNSDVLTFFNFPSSFQFFHIE